MIKPAYSGVGAELRLLFGLAWPVIIGNLGAVGLWVADTVMVGQFGGAALAAVALASTWSFGVSVIARGAAKGLDPLVAQAFGRGDRFAAGRSLVHGLWMAAILSVPVILLHLVGGPGLRLLGQPESLLELAGAYSAILAVDVPFMLAFAVLQQFLQALGLMRPSAVAILLGNVLNIGLNQLFMHGLGPIAGLGPLGCAFATVISQVFMLGVLLILARRELRAWWPEGGLAVGRDLAGLWQVFSLGLPVGVQFAIETWGFQLAGIMVGWIGEVELAAHAIALNISTVSFMTPMGIGAAVATRVGQLQGAGRDWGLSAATGIGMGAAVMSLSAIVFTSLPAWLGGLYTNDLAVIAMMVLLLPVAGAFQLFDGVQVVSFGVLRGLADVRVPTAINLVAYWGMGLPLAWVLGFPLGLGARGVWMGLVLSLAVVAGLLLLRIRALHRRRG